ncbi:unnamed protein product [Phaedon cochleariae]|uniref:Geminin n=1 Tax=Phaedon cochleariae TaxID=80249 RepID=A0A9N9WX81_PHACE|nr:unnamed protein product [Phaedon cochleariae]
MKTTKAIITISALDQENNKKNVRRTLKDIQKHASDKENLVGRSGPHTHKDPKSSSELDKPDIKKKKIQMQHKCIQVGECTITAEDLTLDEPSADYWKRLAETRGQALDDSINENEKLKEDIAALQEENMICKEMLDESKHLVEVLQVRSFDFYGT